MSERYGIVIDFGLNGAGFLGVWDHVPSEEEINQAAKDNNYTYPPSSVTGYGGYEVVKINNIEGL